MNEEKEPIVVFDDSIKEKIVNSLGLRINRDSILTDESGKIITSQDFEPISVEEFGGVLKGSKVSIKNKESELVKFFLSKA